jgi:nucleoside-diphosphate-sugar epimerase
MRVIVTGASGFIGRNVCLRAPRDWQVFALYRHSEEFETFVKTHHLANVTPVRCDLLDEVQVRELSEVTGGRSDAVLYLAANGNPAASVERPRWDLETNTIALLNFLEHCTADHFVYVSSGAVYEGLTGVVSPAKAVHPRLPYAISKLASEQYVSFFAGHRARIHSFINVRFFGAFGPYEPTRKITTRGLQGLASGQRELVVRGDGENLIDFMYVDDAVQGFVKLTQAHGWTGTVDFASAAPLTVNDVVAAIARALDVPVTIRHEGDTAEYIRFRTADRTMRERFGVVPSISLDEGLQRLAAYLACDPHGVPDASGRKGPSPVSPER